MARLGIEIENNDTTPMEDVVRLVAFVFGKSTGDAFGLMLKVHKKGRACVATFPTEQLDVIKARLDGFLANMEKPVTYFVTDHPPDMASLKIDAGDLPDWETFQKRETSEKMRSTIFTVLWVAIIVLTVLIIGRLVLS